MKMRLVRHVAWTEDTRSAYGMLVKEHARTYLATGIILSASDRLRQKPAPPVANQKEIFC